MLNIIMPWEMDGNNNNNNNTRVRDDVEKAEPSYTVGGNVKWCSYFGKQSDSSSKCQTQSSQMTQYVYSQVYAQENKNIHSQKLIHTNVHSSIIQNSQKIETTTKCPSTDEQLNKRGRLRHQTTGERMKCWSVLLHGYTSETPPCYVKKACNKRPHIA